MRPAYVPPEPHLATPTPWEWTEDPQHGRIVRVWSPTYKQWSRQAEWTGIVLERLEAEDTFDAIVAAIVAHDKYGRDPRDLRSKVGTYLYSLWVDGVVRMDFPSPPARFADHLETLGELGRGGVGIAWRCHDHDRGEDVVVKHAWDYFHPLASMDRLMRKEAETFALFDHPGILRLHATFERDGLFHMVRELVDGKEIHADGPPGHETLVHQARGLIDILVHAHARGRLLLDLRPANFFVREQDGAVVLVDVGNCVPYDGGPIRLKKALGSPAFSAPEVARKQASAASDVYALGRLLFTLATGRPPLPKWTVTDMAGPLADHPMADLVLALVADRPEERPSLEETRARLT